MTISAWVTLAILLCMFVLLCASRLAAAAIFRGGTHAVSDLRLSPAAALLDDFSNQDVLTVGVVTLVLVPIVFPLHAT